MTGYIAKLEAMTPADRRWAIAQKTNSLHAAVRHSQQVTNAIARTSSSGWELDEWNIETTDLLDDECEVEIHFAFEGDAEEDMGMSGTRIVGTATARILDDESTAILSIECDVVLD